ncbi:MAG: putative toxin-antitoxin system toxin component, PIN family [Thaumarchaeota archaeon]|nr:putative toxin-antitoxin system toxin component, PIN family [Nitrososphaerota archaeon]
MGKIKAVLDTNILVSLLFKKGLAKEFSKLMEKGSVEFYSSEEILGELARVLTYLKIEQVFKKAGINKTTALESIVEILKIVNPKVKVDAVKSDPLDNKVLECALEAGANYVVSGDRHLLELRRFRKIEILTAREFLEETSSSS